MTEESLGESLHFNSSIPMAWTILGEKPDIGAQLALSAENKLVFQAHSILEEDFADKDAKEESNPIDTKLDLILALLAQSLIQHTVLPDVCKVCLSSQQLRWQGTGPKKPAWIKLDLFLSAKYPKPLGLFVWFNGQQDNWYEGELLKLEASVHDELEKFIFRHHRREIAMVKQETSA